MGPDSEGGYSNEVFPQWQLQVLRERAGITFGSLLGFGAYNFCMLACSASSTVLHGAGTTNAGLFFSIDGITFAVT